MPVGLRVSTQKKVGRKGPSTQQRRRRPAATLQTDSSQAASEGGLRTGHSKCSGQAVGVGTDGGGDEASTPRCTRPEQLLRGACDALRFVTCTI